MTLFTFWSVSTSISAAKTCDDDYDNESIIIKYRNSEPFKIYQNGLNDKSDPIFCDQFCKFG
jgi:hypothetical protein